MLDHILRFALKQKMLMILAAVLLLAAGAYSWQKLPIDAFPDVTNVQVMILAEAPGLTLIVLPVLYALFNKDPKVAGIPQVAAKHE